MTTVRTGTYEQQLSGELTYKAFIPKPLPPDPPILFNPELLNLLSRADRAIGRLDGILNTIPNPDLLVIMYSKKEAVLSSQIEGTQASLSDILEKEEAVMSGEVNEDVKVTLNYITAMKYGLERIKEFPLSLRFIREVHKILLTGVRGKDKEPGEFRRSQNWVGPEGCTLATATFIPPPVSEMNEALYSFEKYLHAEKIYPVLIECGLIHAQFETVHPFLDGNGRIGRLLITFLLCLNKVIAKPLLYLSYYFKKHKMEYYDTLMSVRNTGDWECWLKFFLTGIIETTENVVDLSNKIMALKKRNLELVRQSMPRYSAGAVECLEKIYLYPVFTISLMKKTCQLSYNTAKNIIKRFVSLHIVTEKTAEKRNRRYFFYEYINLLNEGTELK